MIQRQFIETNILVRIVANDNPVQSPQSTALIQRMAEGEFQGLVSMTVLFEAVYVLTGVYELDRISIGESLIAFMGTPGISLLDCEAAHFIKTVALYMSIPRLSFADCYHAVLSLALCDGETYTFDQDFDRVPALKRLEPGAISEPPERPAPHPE